MKLTLEKPRRGWSTPLVLAVAAAAGLAAEVAGLAVAVLGKAVGFEGLQGWGGEVGGGNVILPAEQKSILGDHKSGAQDRK